jgi:hypothetical protein
MIKFTKKNLFELNNIGDVLCTPDNYFDMSCDKDITIIGGGVWNIEKLSNSHTANKTIVWSAGRSIRHPNKSKKLPKLNFLKTGIRDILDLDDSSIFLPCVSCLNETILKEPHSNKTLVFTNANEKVSHDIRERDEDLIYLKNSCSLDDFLIAWNQCSRVITNSYHGIYWSFLSGREVSPYGYSSKFVNVTALFDIEFPEDNLYDVKNRSILKDMVKKDQTFFSVKDYSKRLDKFRELNLNFADSLKVHDIQCKLKTQ